MSVRRMKKLLPVQPSCRRAADLIRNSFIISANMLSLPQGSVLEVALRSPGVAAGWGRKDREERKEREKGGKEPHSLSGFSWEGTAFGTAAAGSAESNDPGCESQGRGGGEEEARFIWAELSPSFHPVAAEALASQLMKREAHCLFRADI